MSANQLPKDIDHSTYEFRVSELEEGFKKHEVLLINFENHAKQLNELKAKLVRIFSYFKIFDTVKKINTYIKKGIV
jgi:hypothetical protein